MNRYLVYGNLSLLILLAAACYHIWRQRRWLQWAKAACGMIESPIEPIDLADLDPLFERDDLGPHLESEVSLLGGGVLGGTTETETWILAVLAKRATRMFEFGTATGRTAYLWAKNSRPEATVVTLTLPAGQRAAYVSAPEDTPVARDVALAESNGSRFYYTGTEVERKVTQLFGDSKHLDEAAFGNQFDLIFVDGSHGYSYVKSDTEKALRMVKEGGLILWHDYRAHCAETLDVYRYLNELSRSIPLRRIAATALVCYRAPGAGAN